MTTAGNKLPTQNTESRTILGIDPGTSLLGFGIIECNKNSVKLIDLGVLNLSKEKDPYQKLRLIYEHSCGLISNYKPGELSIEAPFFGKNVQSMLKLGRAQGVAIAAAMSFGLEIHEYAPRKIKQSITGNGNASKEQLAKMLQSILGLDILPKQLDATDGLAAAVCHFYQRHGKTSTKTSSSWESFVSQNQSRITK